MKMRLSEVAEVFGTSWVGEDLIATGISTDSRSIKKGDFFIALVGDNFDGHDYISVAQKRGAVGALISKDAFQSDAEIISIKTSDTTKGLGLLAHYWHKKCGTKTIAITGSVGKTTVKEMLAAMLSRKINICVTSGNFNNQIGLPLTLFKETKEDQIAVIEMGASGKGEIAQLCEIATPEIGIVTQIAGAHLSSFGSIKGVAEAKSELFSSLPSTGSAIINLDSEQQQQLLKASSHCQQIKVSLHQYSESDLWAEKIKAVEDGWNFNCCSADNCFAVILNLPGKHNITNALMALAGVKALGLNAEKFSQQLASLKAVPGRLEINQLPFGGKLFDDSYNANPTSVKAAIDMLAEQPGKSILVLGDMAELGDYEQQKHKECGYYARKKKIQKLFSIGDLSSHAVAEFGEGGKIFTGKKQLVDGLFLELTEKTNIVVKGSRSAKMEQVVKGLLEKLKRESSQKGNLLSFKKRQKKNKKQEQI